MIAVTVARRPGTRWNGHEQGTARRPGVVGAQRPSRLEYTVIGDPVNEAARLTELAKDLPGRAVASEPAVCAASLDEREHWVRHADVELRGRGEPTTTWVRRSG